MLNKLRNFLRSGRKNSQGRVRTRIAPSPTGLLHIGTARTALFNYLFTKKNGGEFILRIEDTDIERSEPQFEKDILDGLGWLNIKWDEGPYRQSERIKIYEKYIQNLLKEGKAFWCPHTKEDLAQEKQNQMEKKEAPRHECEYKDNKKSVKEGIIRLNTPKKIVKFNDLIRGEIKFDTSLLGDISLAKNEQTPLYNFAAVIDDYEMKISYVIRGEDHISNTPKQILIQGALGLPSPSYTHLPLILGPDRSKLSKRHGTVSINEYRKVGYLPEAMVNFMAFLGWNPGTEQEIFSIEQLIEKFSLDRVQKGGAIFNIDRLNWLNAEYIRKKPTKELTELILKDNFLQLPEGQKFDENYIERIVALEQPRLSKLSEIKEKISFFFSEPVFPKSLLFWEGKEFCEETKAHLDKILDLLSNIGGGDFEKEKIKEIIWPYAEEKGRGNVLWPFRVALTGQRKSPDPFEISEILGKEKTLERIQTAIKLLD